MKILFRLAVALLLSQVASEATTIYQNNAPGAFATWFRATIGDNTFHNLWSVTNSLQSDSGNQYGRFDFNIPSLPSNPGTIWYGGFNDSVSGLTALPVQWQLSFDISLNTLEPVEVSFTFGTGPPSFQRTVINYWVEPANVGWQNIVINQNSTTTAGFGGAGPGFAGAYLSIALASQDPNGNPLSISHIGTYDFLLDNVLLQSVPEPASLALVAISTAGTIFLRRKTSRR
jgi:hypothetical protein